jgi:hypothetical protein
LLTEHCAADAQTSLSLPASTTLWHRSARPTSSTGKPACMWQNNTTQLSGRNFTPRIKLTQLAQSAGCRVHFTGVAAQQPSIEMGVPSCQTTPSSLSFLCAAAYSLQNTSQSSAYLRAAVAAGSRSGLAHTRAPGAATLLLPVLKDRRPERPGGGLHGPSSKQAFHDTIVVQRFAEAARRCRPRATEGSRWLPDAPTSVYLDLDLSRP